MDQLHLHLRKVQILFVPSNYSVSIWTCFLMSKLEKISQNPFKGCEKMRLSETKQYDIL